MGIPRRPNLNHPIVFRNLHEPGHAVISLPIKRMAIGAICAPEEHRTGTQSRHRRAECGGGACVLREIYRNINLTTLIRLAQWTALTKRMEIRSRIHLSNPGGLVWQSASRSCLGSSPSVRNPVANRWRGSRGTSVKQFSARRSRERFRCQRGATQPQLEIALRVIGTLRFQF